MGRAEETETRVQEALRLSPRDTLAYRWTLVAGFAKLALGADEQAIGWMRRSIENNRTSAVTYFGLAAALAHLARVEEAGSEVQSGLALDPTFTIDRFHAGATTDNPVFLARRERIIAGMRMAGMPER